MRKLLVIKTLVDYIWIITCIPLIPILLFLSIYIFFTNDPWVNWLSFENINGSVNSIELKIYSLFLILFALTMIYCVYLFRNTLRKFQQRKPFDTLVIHTYKKLGKIMVISGIVITVISFGFKIYYLSKLQLYFGITPYLTVIGLGLFFLILSEVFYIAKTAKEENELTI